MTKTLWRELLYREVKKISLNGVILDLGGSYASEYQKHMGGEHIFKVVNMDNKLQRDYEFDLEKPFETEDESFDAIVCFNVLEHIYNYENVLKESIRTLKKEGAMVLAVPFLIQLHPSPKDHWRFSEETLSRMFFDTGFEDVSVRTLGTGLFGALAQLSYGILHYSMFRWSVKKIAVFLDTIIKVTIKNNVYGPAQYPLGYIVIARKK